MVCWPHLGLTLSWHQLTTAALTVAQARACAGKTGQAYPRPCRSVARAQWVSGSKSINLIMLSLVPLCSAIGQLSH
jgi:hypothetical protein